MNELRGMFLRATRQANGIAGRTEVSKRWDEQSALERMTIGHLVAHLARTATNVIRYLDAPEPDGEAVTAAQYYAQILTTSDLDADVNASVRTRAEEDAAPGYDAVMKRWDDAIEALEQRLEAEPAARKVSVYDDIVMELDQYLITRIVEAVIHLDDLTVSLGHGEPGYNSDALDLVVRVLQRVARIKYGDLAVMRAMARRERDTTNGLRVI